MVQASCSSELQIEFRRKNQKGIIELLTDANTMHAKEMTKFR